MALFNPYATLPRGSASLFSVMIVLIMAGAIVQMTRQTLHQVRYQAREEKIYLQAFYQAQSALHWGRVLVWSQALGWQCRVYPEGFFSVCLYRFSRQYGVLRGASANHHRVLWQRVYFIVQTPTTAYPTERGWSDFCPLSQEDCHEQLPRI